MSVFMSRHIAHQDSTNINGNCSGLNELYILRHGAYFIYFKIIYYIGLAKIDAIFMFSMY